MAAKPCIEPGCEWPKFLPAQRCAWHWLARQPIDVQVEHADQRLTRATAVEGFVERRRVPKDQWPAGWRWCSGCQSFVPLFYVRGSRCRACESRAAHASHVARTYDLDPAEYDRLLAWQGGRCYMCGRQPRSARLAVDHDHETGEVRGLLCRDNERGCNHVILGNITSLAMARRIVAYLEKPPLQRLRDGEEPPVLAYREPKESPTAARTEAEPPY